MVFRRVILAGCMVGSAAWSYGAFAEIKTEVELGLPLLAHITYSEESDFDDAADEEVKTSALVTVPPLLRLSIYAPRFMIETHLSQFSEFSDILGGYKINPTMYVGLFLGINQNDSKSTTKPEIGSDTKSETKTNEMDIGPFVRYRSKTFSQIIEATAVLSKEDSSEKRDSGGTGGETKEEKAKMMLGLEGSYHAGLAEGVYVGPGLGIAMSLSGSEKKDDEKADFKTTTLYLTIADLIVEI